MAETTKTEDKASKKTNDGVFWGIFSKKQKWTESEDGTIARTVKIRGQKITKDMLKLGDDYYLPALEDNLDEKHKEKLMKRISKGKKLSDDEKFYLNTKERIAVFDAMVAVECAGKSGDDIKEVEEKAVVAAVPLVRYTKDEATGKSAVGDYVLNLEGYSGDKKALLREIKAQMLEIYGDEAIATKRFEELVARSNLTEEVKTLDAKENTSGEKQQEQPVAVLANSNQNDEHSSSEAVNNAFSRVSADERNDLHASMQADATRRSEESSLQIAQGDSVRDSMQNDVQVAKMKALMASPKVKMADKEETFQKLVANYGLEAASQLIVRCMVEPATVMKEMGEGFKRSGASLEYFASLDTGNAELMAKVAGVTGVSVEDMKTATEGKSSQTLEPLPLSKIEGVKIEPNISLNVPESIALPSAAETQYDKMLGDKESLTVGDLREYGVSPREFGLVLNYMLKDADHPVKQEDLIPDGWDKGDQSRIGKDFAVELIGRVQARENMALLQSRGSSR